MAEAPTYLELPAPVPPAGRKMPTKVADAREAMTRVLVDNLLAARDGRELPNRV